MFGHHTIYRIYLLSSLLLVMTACQNTTQKSIESLIEQNNQEALHERRNQIQQDLQDLQEQALKIDEYLSGQDNESQTSIVTIDTLRTTTFKHFIEVQGDLNTDENILIYSETSGVIQELPIKKGQAVNRGQLLAVLDDGGLQSQLAQLQSQEQLAKTTFERQSKLWDENIGSEIQYLQAKSSYESAKSAVQQVERQLSKSIIRAPFSGVIDDLMVEEGELSMPGQTPLLRLVSLNNLYIDATVPENYLPSVKEGTEVEVFIRSIGEKFLTSVAQVGNHINPENRTFKTRILIPSKIELARPNQIASIRLNDYTNDSAITIPNTIIQVDAQGQPYVYIFEKDENNKSVSKRKNILLGKTQENQTEVLSGLKPEDLLIIEGAKSVRDGQRVRLQN